MGFIGFIMIALVGRLPAWLQRRPAPGADRPQAAVVPGAMRAPVLAAATAHGRSVRPASERPCALRIVCVRDSERLPGRAGRMRISGRMADVCAELDRLAAHEEAACQR